MLERGGLQKLRKLRDGLPDWREPSLRGGADG